MAPQAAHAQPPRCCAAAAATRRRRSLQQQLLAMPPPPPPPPPAGLYSYLTAWDSSHDLCASAMIQMMRLSTVQTCTTFCGPKRSLQPLGGIKELLLGDAKYTFYTWFIMLQKYRALGG